MVNNVSCETNFLHPEIVKQALNSMPEQEILYTLAEFFKMFGDTTRIKILHTLFISEMCVCDLAELLNISQSAVSHQLKTLRQANLVKYRREGKVIFYSLKDEHVKQIVDLGIKHIQEKGIM